jgi:phosphoadenosine phosphosulfate reductase
MSLEFAALHAPFSASTSSDTGRPARTPLALPPETASAEELIVWAEKSYGEGLALSSSFGADAALMLHLVTSIIPDVKVIFIDTGYLFPETYRFAEELKERFHLNLRTYSPKMSSARQEALYGQLWEQGDVGVRRYLQMNKVEPMQRALDELRVTAWLAGLRASQTEHRKKLGRIIDQDGRTKIHPILHWEKAQVEAYFEQHKLPRHPLYFEGYRSIGDVHSTIPVGPNDDDRAGRFLGAKKECGLHLSADENTSLSASGL